jgi:hypothetical protein
MPEDQFTSAFIENLITLTSVNNFGEVPFEQALEALSKYGLNVAANKDISPNEIKRELSSTFQVEKTGNKSLIIVEKKHNRANQSESSSVNKIGLSASKLFLGVEAALEFVRSQKNKWHDEGSTLDEQLSDLNTFDRNEVVYGFEGNRVIPKSLKVAKLIAASFKKTLNFERIKNVYKEAEFKKSFILTTRKRGVVKQQKHSNKSNNENTRVRFAPQHRMAISIIASQREFQFFSAQGIGFDDFEGWFICNGFNGN